MTLEEAKILADKGNTDAMMMLAGHYLEDKDNDESYELACMYLDRAAEAGNADAILKQVQAALLTARAVLPMVETAGKDESTMQIFERYHYWSHKLLQLVNSLQIGGDTEQFAVEWYIDSIFWLSAMYCLDENYTDILRITKDVPYPVAQALHGMALFTLTTEHTIESSERALTLLKNAMHPSFWFEKYAETQTLEILRMETGLSLSHMLRILENADSAYAALSDMLTNSKDPAIKDIFRKEMSNYHKTLLGKYKYIG